MDSVAVGINPNGGQINNNMDTYFGGTSGSTEFGAWHSANKSWTFNYNDATSSAIVTDGSQPNYFTGVSKIPDYNLAITRDFPPDVKKFVDIYGFNNLGIKLNLGKVGSILGNVQCTQLGDSLQMIFRPILNYDRVNYIQNNGTLISSKMRYNYKNPEVSEGYGNNYISVFSNGGYSGPSVGLRVNDAIMAKAYKGTEGNIRFNAGLPTYLGLTNNVPVQDDAYKGDPAFFDGGSFGSYWLYSIFIEYYDINISTEKPVIWEHDYTDPSGIKWVKSGEEFYIGTNSYASANDNIVKNNGTFINVQDSNGNSGYLNAKMDSSHDWGVVTNSSSLSMVSDSDTYTARVNASGVCDINSTRVYNQFKVVASGDTNYSMNGFSRLVDYPSGQDNTSNEKVYKESGLTSSVEFKSDGTAPTITGVPSSNWTRNNVVINAAGTDSRSGMNYVKIFKDETEMATGLSSASLTEVNEGVNNYKIVSRDNVGNVENKPFTINIDRTAPIGIVTDTLNEKTFDLDISVKDIIEKGSGVDRIWVKYYDKNNDTLKVERTLKDNNGVFSGQMNLQDGLNGNPDIVKVEVWTSDKVGNSKNIWSKDFESFKIEATIERVLEPHTPLFMGGEKGNLRIKMYGGIDKLKITFPDTLSKLDNKLNAEFNVTPEKAATKDYEFFIPLEGKSGNYSVTVEGFKKGQVKSAQPSFDVKGAITDKLRTRIRIPGVD